MMNESPERAGQPTWTPPTQLYLDARNPRLAGHSISQDDQLGILEWLWRNKAVSELVGSIAANGYWPHEELFAADEGGYLIVVEGNRRLAAVKVLLQPELGERLRIREIPSLRPEIRQTLERLPVIIKSRRDIWEYIGYKHVSGPQEWDSLAKAEYIHRVHVEFEVPLDQIAATIGDQHDTVARLFRGYNVLHQAKREGIFDPDDCQQRRFPFSHLWTALGYSTVQGFLGLTKERLEQPDPVPQEHLHDLQEFLLWLYGSKSQGIEHRVERQNPDLRNLASALGNAKGIQVLRANLPLSAAFEASLGDERLFQDSLVRSEESLREAMRYVATGFHGDEESLRTAASVDNLARRLHGVMKEIASSVTSQGREPSA